MFHLRILGATVRGIQILSPYKSAGKIVEHIRSNFQLRGKTNNPSKLEK